MIISKTPFRISFFGGGTDYPVWYKEHGGAVLSTTIDKYCYITARYYPPFFPVKYRIVWSKIETPDDNNEIEHPSVRETIKYLGIEDGIEIHNTADLPARSGIGSSSAFTVGLLSALYGLTGKKVDKLKLALDAIEIEQNLIKENVGSQDQVATSFGGFNKIVFKKDGDIEVESIDISQDRLNLLQDNLMLFFTGFSRTASEIAKEQIKNTPQKNKELSRMQEMVDEAVDILTDEKKDVNDFGKMLHETWELKRSLADNISTSDVDVIYERARGAGALGGKLLGAGGGGFMVLYVERENQDKVREELSELIHVPFKFESLGSQVIQNGK